MIATVELVVVIYLGLLQPPFQLVHGLESVFPIECEIPSLKLAVELLPDTSSLEERLLHLEHLDE